LDPNVQVKDREGVVGPFHFDLFQRASKDYVVRWAGSFAANIGRCEWRVNLLVKLLDPFFKLVIWLFFSLINIHEVISRV
jgi:hypothetical protein